MQRMSRTQTDHLWHPLQVFFTTWPLWQASGPDRSATYMVQTMCRLGPWMSIRSRSLSMQRKDGSGENTRNDKMFFFPFDRHVGRPSQQASEHSICNRFLRNISTETWKFAHWMIYEEQGNRLWCRYKNVCACKVQDSSTTLSKKNTKHSANRTIITEIWNSV